MTTLYSVITGEEVAPDMVELQETTELQRPSEFHYFSNGKWVLDTEKKAKAELAAKQALVAEIQQLIKTIETSYIHKLPEYQQREEVALAYVAKSYAEPVPAEMQMISDAFNWTPAQSAQIIIQKADYMRECVRVFGKYRLHTVQQIMQSTLTDAKALANETIKDIKKRASLL